MYTRYILQKFLRALLTLWILVTFTFLALRATGNPAVNILGPEATPEALATFERVWGLDQPLFVQYGVYLKNLFQGNFGESYRDGRDATDVVFERVPKTLQLNLTAFVIMLFLAFPAGILAALHRNSWIDRLTMTISVLGFALPNFFLGIVLILVFSMELRLLPSSGSDSWQHMILPVATLAVSEAGVFARFIRSSMLEVINQPYIRTAQSKGLRYRDVLRRHAIPNFAIPMVTLLGLRLVAYIGGSVVVETVFAWPGLGRLTVTAVANRDLAVVQLIVFLVGIMMVTVNLTVDLLYGWLDPRIRVQG